MKAKVSNHKFEGYNATSIRGSRSIVISHYLYKDMMIKGLIMR